jgi:hypothetical protein
MCEGYLPKMSFVVVPGETVGSFREDAVVEASMLSNDPRAVTQAGFPPSLQESSLRISHAWQHSGSFLTLSPSSNNRNDQSVAFSHTGHRDEEEISAEDAVSSRLAFFVGWLTCGCGVGCFFWSWGLFYWLSPNDRARFYAVLSIVSLVIVCSVLFVCFGGLLFFHWCLTLLCDLFPTTFFC